MKESMKIKENDSDQYASFINGLTYCGLLALILLFLCFVFDESLFDYTLTPVSIVMVCIGFFILGLKKVDEKNLGFLTKLGKRNFEEIYSEGWYWIFPLWSFKQKPHFDTLNEANTINVKCISRDEIPLDIEINYFWQVMDPKKIDDKGLPTFIKTTLKYHLENFVKNNQAIELLCDEDIPRKLMVNHLEEAGEQIGIKISNVFPGITYESQYLPIVRKYQEKYKDLKYEFDKQLKHQQIKASDMEIYQNQILNTVKSFGFSNEEAIGFMKVYKNEVNMNEHIYSVTALDKIIENILSYLKSRK